MTKTVVIDIILIIVTVVNLLIVYHYGSMVSQDVKRAESTLTILTNQLENYIKLIPSQPVEAATTTVVKTFENNNPARIVHAGKTDISKVINNSSKVVNSASNAVNDVSNIVKHGLPF